MRVKIERDGYTAVTRGGYVWLTRHNFAPEFLLLRLVWATVSVFSVSSVCAQDPIQVHGYVQGRFTDQGDTSERLEIRRARLIVSGDPLSKLSYRFQVDFAKTPYLMDASVTIPFSKYLSIATGQMKIPFSTESLLSDDRNQPVARSRAVLSLAPGRDTGVQGRDVGVQMSGSIAERNRSLIEYTAGVFRGQTFVYAPQVHYNATAGRIVVHPVDHMSVAANWYGSFAAPPNSVKRREDLEAGYSRGQVTVRAEQIFARDGERKRRGGYLLFAYRLSSTWELLTRADWLNTNVRAPNASSIAYIAGGNLHAWKHIKIGLNVGAQQDEKTQAWSSVVLAQIMAYFGS